MWPCYGMHITVCMALLVCVLCQPVDSCTETSLHQLDFFLEIFSWRLVSVLFSICYEVPPTHLQLMRHSHTCAPMNGIQQPIHSAPQSESAGGKSQLCSKQSSNEASENFLTFGGYLGCYTYRVMALGWLKKVEEKKKKKNPEF